MKADTGYALILLAFGTLLAGVVFTAARAGLLTWILGVGGYALLWLTLWLAFTLPLDRRTGPKLVALTVVSTAMWITGGARVYYRRPHDAERIKAE